jgi:hypothetical protein
MTCTITMTIASIVIVAAIVAVGVESIGEGPHVSYRYPKAP